MVWARRTGAAAGGKVADVNSTRLHQNPQQLRLNPTSTRVAADQRLTASKIVVAKLRSRRSSTTVFRPDQLERLCLGESQ
jgi:hypothetical protein